MVAAHFNLAETHYKRYKSQGHPEDERLGDENAEIAQSMGRELGLEGFVQNTAGLKREILGAAQEPDKLAAAGRFLPPHGAPLPPVGARVVVPWSGGVRIGILVGFEPLRAGASLELREAVGVEGDLTRGFGAGAGQDAVAQGGRQHSDRRQLQPARQSRRDAARTAAPGWPRGRPWP